MKPTMLSNDTTSSSNVNGDCKKFRHLLGAYVDGELEPSCVLEIDEHVAGCESCSERMMLDRAIRGSLKRTLKPASAGAPSGLRERVAAAMAAEKARGEARDRAAAEEAKTKRASAWHTLVPLASAAALALVWGAATRGPLTGGRSTSTEPARAGVAAGDDVIEELVSEHARPLPPERTDPKDVRAFEQYVGVPVRPASFERRTGARLVGGRMVPLHHAERAAMLQYEVPSGSGGEMRRVSVLVFDPRRIQVNDDDLAPRAVGTAEVRVGRANGYSVAVTQRAGVGYALASDMDTERSAQLAALTDE